MNKTKLKAEIKRGRFCPQEERVLNFIMEHKGITTLDAFTNLGITRLSAIIFNLKKKGISIIDEYIPVKNRFNESCTVKLYSVR